MLESDRPACCEVQPDLDLHAGRCQNSARHRLSGRDRGANGKSVILDSALLFGPDPYRYPQNLPIVGAKGGPGGKPGCGSLPDVAKNWPVRQLITNTGWGTGLDIRPNPGIGFPGYANYFPVTGRYPNRRASAIRAARRLGRCPTPARRPTGHSCTPRTGLRCVPACRRRRPRVLPREPGPPPPGSEPFAVPAPAQLQPTPRHRRCPHAVNTGTDDEAAMRENLRGAIWRSVVFLAVCALGLVAMLAVFAQLRFETERTYTAEFTHGVRAGERQLRPHRRGRGGQGQEHLGSATTASPGRVQRGRLGGADARAAERSSVTTTSSAGAIWRSRKASVAPDTKPGDTIPLSHTSPALDLDALIGGFRPLFRALDPDRSTRCPAS